MAVYVSDLLRLKNFSETKLIAGRQGLGNHISWPYVCVSFSDFAVDQRRRTFVCCGGAC